MAAVVWEEVADLDYTLSPQTLRIRCLFIHIWSVQFHFHIGWLCLFLYFFVHLHVFLCSDPTLDSHVLSMVIISLTDMRPLFVFGFYVEISFPYSCTFV